MRRRVMGRKLGRIANWVWHLFSFLGMAATAVFIALYQAGFFDYLHKQLPGSVVLKLITWKVFAS